MTVDGRTATTPVEVRLDPRSQASRAELEEQLALALALRGDLDRLSGAVRELRSVRGQAKARAEALRGVAAAAPLVEAAEALARRCNSIEERLHNPEAEVSYDILARPGGAKLYSRLAPLFGWVHDGDGAPTQGMKEVHAELRRELDALLAEWKAVLEGDVAALNAKARQLAPDLVVVPPRTE